MGYSEYIEERTMSTMSPDMTQFASVEFGEVISYGSQSSLMKYLAGAGKHNASQGPSLLAMGKQQSRGMEHTV